MDKKKRKPKVSVQKPKAVYELKVVREILRYPNPNVVWVFRKDGKNNYEKLGYAAPEALNIVRKLRPQNFDLSLPPLSGQESHPVDVYKIQEPDNFGKLRTLYMKFFVRYADKPDQKDQLVMISFHE
ncbi:MAG: hypothetical protein BWX73_00810 [Lentisphaerae bacterium ADurb.Bin082]|nr:MAG: hypothetical protein BWX73_00810 [Lentisphaerae bacterium ADurb.Bin082]HQL87231.1 hypothetical protein [Lentisphaeria bacterium]